MSEGFASWTCRCGALITATADRADTYPCSFCTGLRSHDVDGGMAYLATVANSTLDQALLDRVRNVWVDKILADPRRYIADPQACRVAEILTSREAYRQREVPQPTRRHRLWCFLVHRWWVSTKDLPDGRYACLRCGEKWSRA